MEFLIARGNLLQHLDGARYVTMHFTCDVLWLQVVFLCVFLECICFSLEKKGFKSV